VTEEPPNNSPAPVKPPVFAEFRIGYETQGFSRRATNAGVQDRWMFNAEHQGRPDSGHGKPGTIRRRRTRAPTPRCRATATAGIGKNFFRVALFVSAMIVGPAVFRT
jgi:hypothetical protein